MTNLFKHVEVSPESISLYPAILHDTELTLIQAEPSLNEMQLKQAKEEGYQEGYLIGKTKADHLAQEQMNSLKTQLEELLLTIPQAIAQNRLELHTEIADILWLIIQRFFVEQQSNHKAIELQINQILLQINSKQAVELCLHPQEIIALQHGEIQLNASHLNGLQIKSDESLRLGGCVIKTEHGVFDASLEKQIDKLKEALLHMRQGKPHVSLD